MTPRVAILIATICTVVAITWVELTLPEAETVEVSQALAPAPVPWTGASYEGL